MNEQVFHLVFGFTDVEVLVSALSTVYRIYEQELKTMWT